MTTRILTWACLTEGCPEHGRAQRTPDGATPEQALYVHLAAVHGGQWGWAGDIRADGAP